MPPGQALPPVHRESGYPRARRVPPRCSASFSLRRKAVPPAFSRIGPRPAHDRRRIPDPAPFPAVSPGTRDGNYQMPSAPGSMDFPEAHRRFFLLIDDVFQAPPARQSEYSPDPACGSPRGSRAASSCHIHFRRQSRCIPLDLPEKRHLLGSSFRGTVFLSLLPLTYFSSL